MALSVMSWDLPPEEQIQTYNEKARTGWIPSVLRQAGVKEFRAYRNPYLTTPQAMVHIEWDSLASWLKYLDSEDYAKIVSELRGVGCTNISAEVWGSSPLLPEPLKPSSG
jgi:heme-degrading monooxygenase HmoA